MKSSKSTNSLANQQQYVGDNNTSRRKQPDPPTTSNNHSTSSSAPTSPICRCRVMYLGSAVPHITKDGLQGIQGPLRELYPDKATLASGNAGIDSWLSVWSNGILIENVDETGREVRRFFKIDALHYCAAVKYVPQIVANSYTSLPNGSLANMPKFLPLDSPHARMQVNDSNPPLFASILRRTTGVKVLECHAFICKREAAANALVRCCFHAYADTMYAKQIGANVDDISSTINSNHAKTLNNPSQLDANTNGAPSSSIGARRSKSIAAFNDGDKKLDVWHNNNNASEYSDISSTQHDIDHQNMDHSSIMRRKSMNNSAMNGGDNRGENFSNHQLINNNLQKQQKLSKSLYHINQPDGPGYGRPGDFDNGHPSQSTSFHNLHKKAHWPTQQDLRNNPQQQQQQPFYNPYESRVPSYPPQNIIDQKQTSNGGTLRSIKSVAANSIASTLLRSKKHAKAMSMAQLNQDKITSFHQPQSNGSTFGGSFLMPPVPPMFLPNMPRPIINGSQTMKAPSRPFLPVPGPMNFEAMTPKELKKLLKKSAKYGIDPNRFGENGLHMLPLKPLTGCHIPPPPPSKSGTINSQTMFPMCEIPPTDTPDMAMSAGLTLPGAPFPDPSRPPIKSILVKPNPEFLKSKDGKKWLKQQKEFKKLLPPHLDGLPIVFGPPPFDALEPTSIQVPNPNLPPPNFISPHHPGLPVMDSSGYYNPHPFYGPSGRASAASTLIRYSPHSQMMLDNHHIAMNGTQNDLEYMHRNQAMYGPLPGPPHPHPHYGHHHQHGHQQPMNHRDYTGDDSSSVVHSSELGAQDRQFNFTGPSRVQSQRNHMVEQSVISLGDENDGEDDDDNLQGDDSQLNGYYNRVESHQSRSRSSSSKQLNNTTSNNENNSSSYNEHQDYEQVMPIVDDQSSYSSGIYRRGHINERAFSYSIRQEHKSSGGMDSDTSYATRSDQNSNHIIDHELQYDNPQNYGNIYNNNNNGHNNIRNEDYATYQGNDPQAADELAERLENKLNMKTFANSRIKSHM